MPLSFPTYDPTDMGNEPGSGPLRVGGQSLGALPNADEDNRPDTLCKSAKAQAPAVELVRDCYLGTERLRERSTTYLPQEPGETAKNYRIRLLRSVFFNVLKRTIEGLVGQVFKKDPKLGDDVPAPIVDQWENIDNAGTHGDVFLRDLLQDALTTGHAAILVDYPSTGGQLLNRAEEEGLRPYWVPIKKENILSWRTAVIDGKTVLMQVVLRECTMVPSGAFGEKEQVRYRVLYRDRQTAGFQLLEMAENKKDVILKEEGIYGNQVEIPLAEIQTSGSKSIFESDPPLLDLAYLNIAHYQQWSDYATSIHKTCVPILTRIGFDSFTDEGKKEVVVGPNAMLDIPLGGDLKYTSHDGSALAESKASLDDLVANMATLGLAMTAPDKRAAETATAKRMDKSTEESSLAVTARGLEDGAERALGFHARYLKAKSGGSIDINREFDEQTMQADILAAWTQAVNAGVPARLMIEAMQVGGLIGPDEDAESIALEMEAAAQAKADAEAQALQDRASMANSARPKPKAA